MSNHLITASYKADLGTPMRKSVMVLLADKASDDGSGIWASKQTMADELCCSKQAVITTIKAFISEGLLVEDGQRKSPNGYTNCYAINVKKLHSLKLVNCWSEKDKGSTSFTGQPPLPVNETDLTSQPPLPHQSTSLTQTPLNHPEPSNDCASGDAPLTANEIAEGWNELAEKHGLPKIKRLTPDRKKKLAARMRENGIDDFREALAAIDRTRWMHGENDRGWKADFDFFLQPKSFTKLMEGAYG